MRRLITGFGISAAALVLICVLLTPAQAVDPAKCPTSGGCGIASQGLMPPPAPTEGEIYCQSPGWPVIKGPVTIHINGREMVVSIEEARQLGSALEVILSRQQSVMVNGWPNRGAPCTTDRCPVEPPMLCPPLPPPPAPECDKGDGPC